jgi:cytochrome c553
LRGFKAQTRADIDGNMTTSAQPLSAQDIENIAQYIASLPSGPQRPERGPR